MLACQLTGAVLYTNRLHFVQKVHPLASRVEKNWELVEKTWKVKEKKKFNHGLGQQVVGSGTGSDTLCFNYQRQSSSKKLEVFRSWNAEDHCLQLTSVQSAKTNLILLLDPCNNILGKASGCHMDKVCKNHFGTDEICWGQKPSSKGGLFVLGIMLFCAAQCKFVQLSCFPHPVIRLTV